MNYTIIKSQIECYKLRSNNSEYWADVAIDAKGKSGRISIASDFGGWQYYWGACGCSFKEFLISLDIHYVAGKFGEGRWFDAEKTVKLYKELILQDRRREEITAEAARDMWTDLEGLEDCNSESFYYEFTNSSALNEHFEDGPDYCYSVSPQFKAFWERVWPVFITELKKEIAEPVTA
jgi:hypothetical protein